MCTSKNLISSSTIEHEILLSKFGSWVYDGLKLDVELYEGREEVDVSDYVPSSEWQLLDQPATRRVKYVASNGEK